MKENPIMKQNEEKCDQELLAVKMAQIGMTRGIVTCEIHGHHNPYDMLRSGKLDALLQKYAEELSSSVR